MISLRTGLAIAGGAGILLFAALHLAADARIASDRDTWRQAAGDYKAAARGWMSAATAQKANRDTEARQARDAVSEAVLACDARVARARASARSIQEIINAPPPPPSPDGCPADRGLVDPGLMWRSLRPDG